MEKQCSKCGAVKLLDEFYRHKRMSDGRSARCKVCVREDQAEQYAKNPEPARERARRWRAENLDWVRKRDARYRSENGDKLKDYYLANRDRIRQRRKVYVAENPHIFWENEYRRRASKYGFEPVIESFTKGELIARWGDKCFHCGGPFDELDHWPLAVVHGAAHTLESCRPSCISCNRKGGGTRAKKTAAIVRSNERRDDGRK